jgi:acetyl esterase/lipase
MPSDEPTPAEATSGSDPGVGGAVAGPHDMRTETRWRRRGLIGLVVLVVIGLLAQPIRLRATALATVADALDLAVPRPFAHEVERREVRIDDEVVDVYGPPSARTTGVDGDATMSGAASSPLDLDEDVEVVVMVPGAAPNGRDDSRLVALAESFARTGRAVVVPELEVYQEDLVPEDLDRLVTVVAAIAGHHGPVVLTGISFGGSLSLIAANDPRIQGDVALVATFGAYADLAGVLQAATTGSALVGDQRFPWDPDPRAEDVVREQLVGLLPAEQGAALDDAFDHEDPSELPDDLRPVYDLLTEDDPARVMALVDDLPAPILDRIRAMSPIRAAPELKVRIVALHARDDPVIPFGELHRLGATYDQADLRELRTFDHVGIDPDGDTSWWVTVRDLWTTAGFVTEVLRATR